MEEKTVEEKKIIYCKECGCWETKIYYNGVFSGVEQTWCVPHFPKIEKNEPLATNSNK